MIENNPYNVPDKSTVVSTGALLYFVWEREAIRIAKENKFNGALTLDPILNKYKFTNIRRKHDRVSQWIIKNIIDLYPTENYRQDLWFILLIARLINWPPTLQCLIDEDILFKPAGDFTPAEFSSCIENFRARLNGGKVYSGAYMVYPTKKDVGSVKSLSLAKHIISPALDIGDDIDSVFFDNNSISDFVRVLSGCFGISTFIAGQVAADLTYGDAVLATATDLYTYAPIGPGSSKGLNYLLKRGPYASWKQDDFNNELMSLNDSIKEELDITDLTLHDVQNVMCEYSKYTRTVLGEGTPKTMYRPEIGF
tara:strand:- start:1214 stop:2143 length:930 start_codon:yes stop_codon:yes gene_type:complete